MSRIGGIATVVLLCGLSFAVGARTQGNLTSQAIESTRRSLDLSRQVMDSQLEAMRQLARARAYCEADRDQDDAPRDISRRMP